MTGAYKMNQIQVFFEKHSIRYKKNKRLKKKLKDNHYIQYNKNESNQLFNAAKTKLWVNSSFEYLQSNTAIKKIKKYFSVKQTLKIELAEMQIHQLSQPDIHLDSVTSTDKKDFSDLPDEWTFL